MNWMVLGVIVNPNRKILYWYVLPSFILTFFMLQQFRPNDGWNQPETGKVKYLWNIIACSEIVTENRLRENRQYVEH